MLNIFRIENKTRSADSYINGDKCRLCFLRYETVSLNSRRSKARNVETAVRHGRKPELMNT